VRAVDGVNAMRVTVYQPQYFPRLHYVNRVLDADVFIALDGAQFTRKLKHHGPDGATTHRSFQAHSPIRLADGTHLLTVPVRHSGARATIGQTRVDYDDPWPARHLRSLQSGYSNAPYHAALEAGLEHLLTQRYDSLADLNLTTLVWGINHVLQLGLRGNHLTLAELNQALAAQRRVRLRQIVLASQLQTQRPEGRQQGNSWIAGMCHELEATEYLCGGTAEGNYLDKEFFTQQGITPVIQSWYCQPYPQQFATDHGFTPNLSILDLVLNVDASATFAIVWPE
jgi:WbqC-like protein